MKLNDIIETIGHNKVEVIQEATLKLLTNDENEDLGQGREYPKYFKVGSSNAMAKYADFATGNNRLSQGPFNHKRFFIDHQLAGTGKITNMGKMRSDLLKGMGFGKSGAIINKWTGFSGGLFSIDAFELVYNAITEDYNAKILANNGNDAFDDFDWVGLESKLTGLFLADEITDKVFNYNAMENPNREDVRHPFTLRGKEVGTEPTIAAFFANEAVKYLQRVYLLNIKTAGTKEEYVSKCKSARGFETEIGSTSEDEDSVEGFGNPAFTPDSTGRIDPRTIEG